jgi:hypothetical protein
MNWWRRGVSRVPRWVIIGVGCVVAGIILGFAVARWTSSSVVGHYESPGSILVSADQRTLTASAGGSCLTGSLDVQETPDAVVARLHTWPSFMIAPGVCAMEIFSARLHAPLGARQLIDGVTGTRLPSFHGQGILRPTFLPSGFVHRYDAAFLNSDTVAGASAGCTQVYTQADSYDESIWISQIAGGHWRTPEGITAKPIVVRGQSGLAINGEIEWTQDGQLFTIQSMTYAYATLGTPELNAIADSLR